MLRKAWLRAVPRSFSSWRPGVPDDAILPRRYGRSAAGALRVNQRTYGWPLTLAWFTVTPVTHTWQPMHDYYLWEVQQHEKFQVRTHVMENGLDAIVLWSFFVGPLLSVRYLSTCRMARPAALLIVTADR